MPADLEKQEEQEENTKVMTFKVQAEDTIIKGLPDKSVIQKLFEKVGLKYEDGDEDRVMKVRASNGEVDSDGDIVNPDGWVNMNKFFQNPVLLYNHNAYSESPVGSVIAVEKAVREKQGLFDHQKTELQSLIYFDRSEQGQNLLDKYKKGVMRALSVRFRPISFREVTDDQRNEYKMGRWGNFIEKQELVELSVVTLPSNRDAIVLQKTAAETAVTQMDKLLGSIDSLSKRLDELKSAVDSLKSQQQKVETPDAEPQPTRKVNLDLLFEVQELAKKR